MVKYIRPWKHRLGCYNIKYTVTDKITFSVHGVYEKTIPLSDNPEESIINEIQNNKTLGLR